MYNERLILKERCMKPRIGKLFVTLAFVAGLRAITLPAHGDPLDSWTSRNSGSTNSLFDVAYADGNFVAVSSGGEILTSGDGANWTVQNSETTNALAGTAFDGSKWVISGFGGTILTSTDLRSWVRQNAGTTNNLTRMIYANARFVVVGDSGTILTSTNGTNWVSRASGWTNRLAAVTYGNGTFVVTGPNGPRGAILTSPDGVVWTDHSFTSSDDFPGVTYGNGIFVTSGGDIINGGGVIFTSPNGTAWTSQDSGAPNELSGVTYANGTFVAVGSAGGYHQTIDTSPDGIHWTLRSYGDGSALYRVTYGDGTFVAVGDNGTILQSGQVGPAIQNVFPIATNPAAVEISDGLAFDGTNYFVILAAGTDLVGQLFSSDGALVGSPISIGSNVAFPTLAAVAFAQNHYLVAWSDHSITSGVDMFGQFISRDGTKAGPKFTLLSAPGSYGFQSVTALAADGTNFLAVWQDNNDRNLYGQLITPSGGLSGPEFLISSQQGNGQGAAVAFGRTNYLVVWQGNYGNGGNDAYAELVSRSGVPGTPFQISQTASGDHNPVAVAFDGSNYLAVWPWDPLGTTGTVTDWDLYGRLVSPTGDLPGSELNLVTDAGSAIFPALAFDGSHYLLAWRETYYNSDLSINATNSNIYYQFFDTSGVAAGSEFTVFTAQGTITPFFPLNGLLFDGNRYAVAASLGTLAVTNGRIAGFTSGEVYGAFLSASVPTGSGGGSPGADQFVCSTNNGTITITGYTGTNDVLTIPSTINGLRVTDIGDFAFAYATMTSLTIPDSVLTVGADAFNGCWNLASVALGTHLTRIGYGAFENCPALTSVRIPASVSEIGEVPFAGDGNLEAIAVDAANLSYTSVNGVLFDKAETTLIQYPGGAAAPSYAIPRGVTAIDADAIGNPNLENVTIPESVVTIEDYAFSGSGLTNVLIPGSVTNLGTAP
ncbi:MAG: leucine-rich repeat protein, partial [Verrucomicrobia bacterium]|nr:leucine-rich repeat protein [Verrucomicrobiota bacterium]